VEVAGPGRHALAALGLAVEVSAAPGAAVAWPLWLRTRRPGDRFRPAGGRGGKKLKAWLIDRKVPQARRGRLALLVDAGGEVLAIPELGARSARLPAGLEVRLAAAAGGDVLLRRAPRAAISVPPAVPAPSRGPKP